MSDNSGAPLLVKQGAIAIVTLRRPIHANRLQPQDVLQLQAYWDQLKNDLTMRAVVLTAKGKHFSGGYDLNSISETANPTGVVVENAFARMVDALEHLPQVTICALNGGVYGGATDLALACDFRYGVSTCEMLVPAARLGLQYYLSGLRRYVSRLGLDSAKRLLLLAEKLDADQMMAIGYLHRIVAADRLLAEALQTAKLVEALAPLAVGGMKAALNAIADDHVDECAIRLSETNTLRSNDMIEGVAAWRDKRNPMFGGS
ncbi:enoyl-CoA hydratase/isomerase family protein [Bradyrhizobium sp. 153]|uniref:enoyl-CoA hydratase/isomerase family protein n=1 Tax=Bradyrhizobium sp. 153 TaxID=2782627 RepID=UPI001FFA5DFE